MLSNKMTVSLMSLITIFALAFVAPSAMAAFDVGISADDVVEGDAIEIEYGTDPILIKFAFGEVIKPGDFAAADLTIVTIDENGAPTAIAASAITIANGTPANGKNYTASIAAIAYNTTPGAIQTTKVFVQIAADAAEKLGDATNKSKAASKEILLVRTEPGADGATVNPDVVSITRATPISHTGGGTFVEEVVTGAFQVKIVLTEKPHGGLADGDAAKRKAALDVAEGTVTDVVAGVPFARVGTTTDTTAPALSEGGYTGTDPNDVPDPSGRDRMYYPYLASITPKGTADMVTIKVKGFKDTVKAQMVGTANEVLPGEYVTPPDAVLDGQPNGRDRLKVKVVKDPAAALAAGHVVNITNERKIPKDGYLIVATDPTMTGINIPTDSEKNESPDAAERTPAEMQYNVIKVALPNLEAFLSNGGIIDLVAPEKVAISEIMWGSDASLGTNSHSQWIEIKNKSGKELQTGDKTYKLIFYGPNEAPPAKTAAVAATATTAAKPAALPAGVHGPCRHD